MLKKEQKLEQSDQLELPQGVIYILELVSNQLELIQEHGLKKHLKHHSFLISIIFLLNLPIYNYGVSNTYFYSGKNNNYPINLKFKVDKNNRDTTLNWSIKSKEFTEFNITNVSDGKLIHCFQTSQNNVDNEHFEWSVTLNDKEYEIIFKNLKYNETFKTTLPNSKSLTTLQALLYKMQNQKLQIGTTFNANLLIPWKTVIPITINVESKETIKLENLKIPTFKVVVKINSLILGSILPKSTLWITEEYPHKLIKQKSFNKSYDRIADEKLSDEIRSLFNNE